MLVNSVTFEQLDSTGIAETVVAIEAEAVEAAAAKTIVEAVENFIFFVLMRI